MWEFGVLGGCDTGYIQGSLGLPCECRSTNVSQSSSPQSQAYQNYKIRSLEIVAYNNCSLWYTAQSEASLSVGFADINVLKPTGYVMNQKFNLLKPTGHVMHQHFNPLKPTGYVMHQQFNLLNPTGYVMHQNFNLLKPTGHVMHQQFNIQQL